MKRSTFLKTCFGSITALFAGFRIRPAITTTVYPFDLRSAEAAVQAVLAFKHQGPNRNGDSFAPGSVKLKACAVARTKFNDAQWKPLRHFPGVLDKLQG